MKVAIITDQHFGVRGDSQVFLDHQDKFYNDIFFPTLDKENIDTVIDLGDTFDRRRFINFVTLKRSKEMYFDKLKKRNVTVHSIVGNHTVFHKNTNETNALSLLMKEYDNWNVYWNEPKELKLGSCDILLSPWITKDNFKVSMDFFNKTKAQMLMGHFEFKGFEMSKGSLCDHGLDKQDFGKFDQIYSGHFHHPSENGNVKYLGAPYEMDWSDFDGKRGFHIFDTEKRDLTFVHNPYSVHHKIEYDDTDFTVEDVTNLDVSPLKNTFIKLIVKNKTNPYIFDLFADKLSDSGCADIKIVEDSLNLESIDMDEFIDESKDTKHILHAYVDSIETGVEKNKIKNVVDELYAEAISL